MDTTVIEQLLYDTSDKKIINWIKACTDRNLLYVLAYNYNWDNGFEIPKYIMNSSYCSLSTALLLFYRAEGELYLQDKQVDSSDKDWYDFVTNLYKKILDGFYKESNIQFKCPLSKVQIYKLSKVLSDEEKVFINQLAGENLDIAL